MSRDDMDGVDDRDRGGKTRRPRENVRHRPYPKEQNSPEAYDSPQHSLRVSGTEDARQVARKLAESCREGDPPALLTIGNTCINQAVKAIAISRQYLKDDAIDLAFQPAFRDEDRTKPFIAFYVSRQKPCSDEAKEDEVELAVASTSKPKVVAGAIAGKIRETKQVFLSAIGVDAVANAVLAIGNARLYLEEDNLDIRVQPEFVHIEKNGKQMNALRFFIIPQKV